MPEATQQRGGRQERITCETPLTLADNDKYHLEIVRMRASVSIHDQFVTMSERLTGKIEIIKNPMFMRGVFVKKNTKVGDLQIPMHAKRIDILPEGFVPSSKDWAYGLGLVHTSKDGREFNGFAIFSDHVSPPRSSVQGTTHNIAVITSTHEKLMLGRAAAGTGGRFHAFIGQGGVIVVEKIATLAI